jgi:hypothetical protein
MKHVNMILSSTIQRQNNEKFLLINDKNELIKRNQILINSKLSYFQQCLCNSRHYLKENSDSIHRQLKPTSSIDLKLFEDVNYKIQPSELKLPTNGFESLVDSSTKPSHKKSTLKKEKKKGDHSSYKFFTGFIEKKKDKPSKKCHFLNKISNNNKSILKLNENINLSLNFIKITVYLKRTLTSFDKVPFKSQVKNI